MEDAFKRVTQGGPVKPVTISVMQGRELHVPRACDGVARFTFAELCQRALGAADYIAIAQNFHTVLLEQVPVLSPDQRNDIRRLIWLVDEFYQRKVRLVCSAAALPHNLLHPKTSFGDDETFAFDRCASRLQAMQSKEYLDEVAQHIQEQKRVADAATIAAGPI